MNASQEPMWSIELRTRAIPIAIPTIRTVGADLAMRADFDLDSIDDVRLAVDEACTALVRLASRNAALNCTFAILVDRIELNAQVQTTDPAGLPPTNSFGWRVLQTLTDGVGAWFVPGAVGQPGKACIQLVKNAASAQAR